MAAATAAIALVACSRSDAHAPPRSRAEPSSGAAMWGDGFFPNVTLTTQLGAKVRFFDDLIRDKVVVINFIYTKCTDACPMETARMLEVQKLLADRLGRDIFFYSISIDPTHDTPEVLKAYADSWHTGPGWTFLTGADEDITLLRKKLGVYEADLKKKDHNLSMIIGNQKTGRWMKRSPYENPYVLADQLGSWLHNWKLPRSGDRDYAKAPEVRNISSGEELFRTRCAACHTVGGGDLSDVAQRRIGPDLRNISRQRERDWLVRWIMHPDQMLASKDPLAVALLAQYQNIVMPNLRLTEGDAASVLQYLDEESREIERRAAAAAPSPREVSARPRPHVVVTGAVATQLHDALTRYDELRIRLAADDLDGARQIASTMATGLRDAAADLAGDVRQLAAARDLAAARLGFGELSRDLIGLLVDNPTLRDGWRLFRCAMAPGYPQWLQADAKLTNPYFGTRMPGCGSAVATWSI
jgi:protein SCO1/2